MTKGAAFLTIDKAANTVAAADDVYVGAGVFRELVTMDTAGTSGNLITYTADVGGSMTDDPGLVIISAYDDESSPATRSTCWDPNEKEFITVTGFVMTGGTTATVNDTHANNLSYEEVTFEDCTILAGHDDLDLAVLLNLNVTTSVPATAGLTFRRNTISGSVHIVYDENATSETNVKMVIESNLWVGMGDTTTQGPGLEIQVIGTLTWPIGGITITNNTFYGLGYCIYVLKPTATTFTNPIVVRNNLYLFSNRDISMSAAGSGGFVDSDSNTSAHISTSYTNVTQGPNDRAASGGQTDPGLFGGLHDASLIRALGWSPYRFMEPITLNDGVDAYTNAVVGAGDTTVAPGFDLYNEARPMGARLGERTDTFTFDASDAGPTDNEATWTNDANAFDGDSSTTATTTTNGTETTDELRGAGTNAPASGGTISGVEARIYTGTVGTQNWRVYTDAEAESLLNTSTTSDDTWSAWSALSVPSGGWTWAKVQALELVLWASTQPGEVGGVQVRVTSTPVGQDDQGAVEARTRPVQDTASVMTGVNSVKFAGAGFQDWLVPVKAQSTTVTIDARFDSNHTGLLPALEVLNIDGAADRFDAVTTAANTTDTLTATFTPTQDGVCRVRVRSRDTSATGEAFFDDLTVV